MSVCILHFVVADARAIDLHEPVIPTLDGGVSVFIEDPFPMPRFVVRLRGHVGSTLLSALARAYTNFGGR